MRIGANVKERLLPAITFMILCSLSLFCMVACQEEKSADAGVTYQDVTREDSGVEEKTSGEWKLELDKPSSFNGIDFAISSAWPLTGQSDNVRRYDLGSGDELYVVTTHRNVQLDAVEKKPDDYFSFQLSELNKDKTFNTVESLGSNYSLSKIGDYFVAHSEGRLAYANGRIHLWLIMCPQTQYVFAFRGESDLLGQYGEMVLDTVKFSVSFSRETEGFERYKSALKTLDLDAALIEVDSILANYPESDVLLKLRKRTEDLKNALDKLVVVYDDIEGKTRLYYPGLEKISQQVGVVPYFEFSRESGFSADSLYVIYGFQREDWVFFRQDKNAS